MLAANACSLARLAMDLQDSLSVRPAQKLVRVALPCMAVRSACFAVTLALMASALVVLPLVLASSSVWLATRAVSFSRLFIFSQACSVSWTAKIWSQAVIRVALLCRVVNLVDASDALAWMSAALVALPLVTLSSLVELPAMSTSLVSLETWLHWDLVEVPSVLLAPLATATLAMARTRVAKNFMLTV